ncbi:hypothetical protein [Granulicella tundricola]|uniref:SH3 domain-containing protein n=1 Tax=Granulicella tundricola (strain ATCC BAA-1859 / DSM 23138 / MP5ACTX9) TaxID=1198114 RepID=E8WZP7_GRATM|nr:hypothetical protein [Granulicella tundricola]ADW70021.1 hypothetical protein AciX9_2998 [Granulicella tundricola MP5ACTX9]
MRSLALALLLIPAALLAQKKPRDNKDNLSGYDRSARATVLHDAVVYVAADDSTQKVAEVTPGHELVIIDHSGPWVKVYANTDTPDEADPDRTPEFAEDDTVTPASGWIKDKGVVNAATPNGDAILFGAATNLEEAASQPHAPKNAAPGAHLLYRRVFEYFPNSPLAAEAAFRSADIRWQLEKLDISTLPSAKEQEAYLRPQLYEGEMKHIMKTYPGTKFAAEAAYDLLDNKLCGDWQGLPKCPEMETKLYLKYADQYPESPRAPEAEYNAVYRQGVAVTMYKVDEDRKHAEAAAKQTQTLADEMRTRFPNSDYTRRAQSIAFRIAQGLSIYGSDRE